MHHIPSISDATLANVGSSVIAFWLQSALLTLIGLASGLLLRRRGPVFECAAYRATLVGVALCCVLSTVAAGRIHPLVPVRNPASLLEQMPSAEPAIINDEPMRPVATGQQKADSNSAFAHAPVEPSLAEMGASAPASELSKDVPTNDDVTSTVLHVATAVYLAVVLARLGLLTLALWRVRLLLSATVAPSERAAELWSSMTSGRRRSPRLRTHFASDAPFLIGWRRAAVVLPGDEADLPDSSLQIIMAHELAHYDRRDALWNMLFEWAHVLLWPQPLLIILQRQWKSASEYVCDQQVISTGHSVQDYARCLLDFAERKTVAGPRVSIGMASFRSVLGKRIEEILTFDAMRMPRFTLRAQGLSILLTVALATSASLAIATEETPKPASSLSKPPVGKKDGGAPIYDASAVKILRDADYALHHVRTLAANEYFQGSGARFNSSFVADQSGRFAAAFATRSQKAVLGFDGKSLIVYDLTDPKQYWKTGLSAQKVMLAVGKIAGIAPLMFRYRYANIPIPDRGVPGASVERAGTVRVHGALCDKIIVKVPLNDGTIDSTQYCIGQVDHLIRRQIDRYGTRGVNRMQVNLPLPPGYIDCAPPAGSVPVAGDPGESDANGERQVSAILSHYALRQPMSFDVDVSTGSGPATPNGSLAGAMPAAHAFVLKAGGDRVRIAATYGDTQSIGIRDGMRMGFWLKPQNRQAVHWSWTAVSKQSSECDLISGGGAPVWDADLSLPICVSLGMPFELQGQNCVSYRTGKPTVIDGQTMSVAVLRETTFTWPCIPSGMKEIKIYTDRASGLFRRIIISEDRRTVVADYTHYALKPIVPARAFAAQQISGAKNIDLQYGQKAWPALKSLLSDSMGAEPVRG